VAAHRDGVGDVEAVAGGGDEDRVLSDLDDVADVDQPVVPLLL
jgi:hypothetical protein